jgi:hypothetical protein
MKGVLPALCVALALLPATAQAQPPLEGSTHTFVDPIFVGTVFCDSYYEVLAIATADDPQAVFTTFATDRNEIDEPVCASIAPTGRIVDVRPLGIMIREDARYDAWAVEAQVNGMIGFALYLEKRSDILV